MNAKQISRGIVRAFLTLTLLLSLFYFLYLIRSVLLFLLIALILSLVANPIVEFFKRKFKIKNTLAVIITLGIFILIMLGFILMFYPLIGNQMQNMALLDTSELEKNFNNLLENINQLLAKYNLSVNKIFVSAENTTFSKPEILKIIPNFLNGFFSIIGNVGMGIASVIFISFFLLKDKQVFMYWFYRILPYNHKDKIINSLDTIDDLLSRYFIGLLIQLLIIMILYVIVFLIFGVENAFIIALLCAVLNIIPYIGPLIALVLALLLIMLNGVATAENFTQETLPTTLYVAVGMFIVQFIDNNFSQPIIFSKSTKSHPLEIFIVILSAGMVLGIFGMIVAVPLYTVLKVVAKEFFPDNKIVKVLTKNL
mgnify:CR=1 FL=1